MATLVRLTALLVLVAATPALTDVSPDTDRQARQLFHSLMSPYCPGSLLAECPSSQAGVLRDTVRARLARGRSPEDIVDDLRAIYGDEILASPPYTGLGGLVWLGTAAIFLGGLGIAAWWLNQRRAQDRGAIAESRAVTTAVDDTELRERLRAQLAEDDD